jgi:hypothetical protein
MIMKEILKTVALAGSIVLGLPVAAPALATAHAACKQWDVSQPWYAIQGSYSVLFALNQQRPAFAGTASYVQRGTETSYFFLVFPTTAFGTNVTGPVTGTVGADSIEMHTGWGGVYIGTIDETGRITGYTYDQRNSNSSAYWYSDRTV